MKPACPWCRAELDARLVRDLGRTAEPCPECGRPIRESIGQVVFTVGLLLPLVGTMLLLSKLLFDRGYPLLSVCLLLAGAVAAIVVQKFLPTVHGPARGR